ncbi:sporulation-delaying protein SdpB family protein [Dactylosporangium sp. NPDC005555]|uniref:sporulation-delaying protein SdpB family protein n=1 Tax=Dactylosporangium sp. NPDC005555 TaxID=3154889 RepID=UPI0033B2E4CF
MLTRLGLAARRAAAVPPWTDVYGLARTLIAAGTLLTLVFSPPEVLFAPVRGLMPAPYCGGTRAISLFCVMPEAQLPAARWLAVAILLVVASGWRPRWTAVPHWWVAFSLQASASIPDGGDQVAANLTLLLLPLALTDRRRWHWSAPGTSGTSAVGAGEVGRLTGVAAGWLIRVQVAGIYLHASLGKLAVPEWRDGTALYYWLNNPNFGTAGWLREPTLHLLALGPAVAVLTWGSLALEFALAVALVLPRRRWPALLLGGLALHGGIAALMGLWSFSLAMFGALILYLRPFDQPFGLPLRWAAVRAGRARQGTGEPAPARCRLPEDELRSGTSGGSRRRR